jgi:TonB family protein
MTDRDEKGSFLISAFFAGAMHVLLAAAALYLSLNAFRYLPAVTEVHLVSNDYAVNAESSIVERREGNGTTAASEKTISNDVEKRYKISQPVEIADTASAGAQVIGQTQKSFPASVKSAMQRVALDTFSFASATGPNFIRRELPEYPVLARRMNKEGKVLLRLKIDEKGTLLNVEVIEPAGFGFTDAALDAVRKSTYRPAVKNGAPAPSLALLPVRFKLTD